MSIRSFFTKNFLMHVILLVLAFAASGGVFYYPMLHYPLPTHQA